jgi:hypothetical protein
MPGLQAVQAEAIGADDADASDDDGFMDISQEEATGQELRKVNHRS